jgi:hypothetical protein
MIGWVRCVAHMGLMRNLNKILVSKPRGKRSLWMMEGEYENGS